MSSDRTRVIGLTGGIGSGKSTVATMFKDLGAYAIDADQVAREVVEPGQPALAEISNTFGREMLDERGRLDRKRLGAVVFADPDQRRALNAIVHPRIGAETARRIAEAGSRGIEVVIYEAALLVENQIHHGLDGLIVVALPPEEQLVRLTQRDRLDEADAKLRLGAQAPLAEKVAAADWVIDNAGPRERTRRQVEDVWRQIRAETARKK